MCRFCVYYTFKEEVMKKLFFAVMMALVFNTAYAFDWESDVTVGTKNFAIGADQDGDKFFVSTHGITFSKSDTVDFGLAYAAGLVPHLAASAYYEYTSDSDNILGVTGSADAWGLSLTPSVEWNINESEFDSTVAADLNLFGLGAFGSVDMNLNDFKVTGSEAGLKYVAVLSKTETSSVTISPNVTLPFDEDWESGELRAGVSVSIMF